MTPSPAVSASDYVPGKSWKSLAEALLRLMPPLTIADLGAGEGSFALLLAQRAVRSSPSTPRAKMIEVARDQARRNGVNNIDYRLGDMEELPIASRRSRPRLLLPIPAPRPASRARSRTKPPGFSSPAAASSSSTWSSTASKKPAKLYADEWLGFTETELEIMLEKSAFIEIQTSVVDKEPEPPNFQTLLAVATKPA